MPPLSKVSSKEQKSTPVLTNYALQREKMEQTISKEKHRKLNLDSDEDYYD